MKIRDVAQSGSVHVWGACGRWFESSRPDDYQVDHLSKVVDFFPNSLKMGIRHSNLYYNKYNWADPLNTFS